MKVKMLYNSLSDSVCVYSDIHLKDISGKLCYQKNGISEENAELYTGLRSGLYVASIRKWIQ